MPNNEILAALFTLALLVIPLVYVSKRDKKYQRNLDRKLYLMCHPQSREARR